MIRTRMFSLFSAALLGAALLSSCHNNKTHDASDNSTLEEGLSQKSFLQGGSYGSVSASPVSKENLISAETLPTLGIIDPTNLETRGLDYENQYFFPFGGFQSSYGTDFSKIGNTKTNTPVTMRARLYPNFELLPEGTEAEVYLWPVMSSQTGPKCFEQLGENSWGLNDLSGENSCFRVTFPVSSFVEQYSAVEFNLELGSFGAEEQFVFAFYYLVDLKEGSSIEGFIKQKEDGREALLALNVNGAVSAELPDNVYAHGGFLPTLDGFGFANLGDNAFDLFTKEKLAAEFGQESVCFVQNGECAALNPYGFYLKNFITRSIHDGSNGLCYGYAFAAMMLKNELPYQGKAQISDYNPTAEQAIELNYLDVRGLISSQYLGQFSKAAQNQKKEICPTLRPTDVVARIEEGFTSADPIASINIFIPGVAGHAITPYAVSDEGNNIKRIYVYDNNYPSSMERFIEVNTTPGAETWQYSASSNASDTSRLYSGRELENPMCPMPLSLYDDEEIAVQEIGSTRFVDLSGVNAQVIDPQGNISGADFSTMTNVNQIPNASLSQFIGLNELTISQLSAPANLSVISSSNLGSYLEDSYLIRAKLAVAEDNQTLNMMQSSTLSPSATVAFGLETGTIAEPDLSRAYEFRAHPTARFVTFEMVDVDEVSLVHFTTLNDEQVGYVNAITVDATTLDFDSLGFFVDQRGQEVIVFEYAADNLTRFEFLSEGVEYEIDTQQLSASETVTIKQSQRLRR